MKPRINHADLHEAARSIVACDYASASRLQRRIDAGEIEGATHAARPDEDMTAYIRDAFGKVADRCCPGWWQDGDDLLSDGQYASIEKAIAEAVRRESWAWPYVRGAS